MQIYTKPFLHAVIEPPIDIYNYAKSIYPEHATLLAGVRTNTAVDDSKLLAYIDSIVDSAYIAFLPRLIEEYPKMDFNSLATKKRYLFSHNTPSTHPNVIRGLHLDNGTKIVIGLWYFKDDSDNAGGDLYLVNPSTKEHTTFEYSTNKLIIFPNLLTAWHAVTKRGPATLARKFINIVLESDIFLHSYNKIDPKEEPKIRVKNNYA